MVVIIATYIGFCMYRRSYSIQSPVIIVVAQIRGHIIVAGSSPPSTAVRVLEGVFCHEKGFRLFSSLVDSRIGFQNGAPRDREVDTLLSRNYCCLLWVRNGKLLQQTTEISVELAQQCARSVFHGVRFLDNSGGRCY